MKKNFISIILFLIFTTQNITLALENSSIFMESWAQLKFAIHIQKKQYMPAIDIEFKIKKLGIDLYKYEATSLEKYEKGQLVNFSSKTNQNNKIKNTQINFNEKKNLLIII